MKIQVLHPIQHNNVRNDRDQFMDVPASTGRRFIAEGLAKEMPNEVRASAGTPVLRKPVAEEEKIEISPAQIAEAKAAETAPELTPEKQFAKTEVANSVVAGGDPNRIYKPIKKAGI